MIVERKEFKSLQIDLKKGIFLLNGEDIRDVHRLDLEFDNGRWSLLVTRDELYEQAATQKSKV